MILQNLVDQLQHFQDLVIATCKQKDFEYYTQYHPDLSPIGWHLGHCIYTENYWIKERLLEMSNCNSSMESLYIPEQSKKTERGNTLPERDELFHWAEQSQKENRMLLKNFCTKKNDCDLMQNNFLLHFLAQHYAQHYETIRLIQNQAELKKLNGMVVNNVLKSTVINRSCTILEHGDYLIGSTDCLMPYDNEYPRHKAEINIFKITKYPVNNAEFLRFIEERGYARKELWSHSGWSWLNQKNISHPEYWRQDRRGNWYGIQNNGAFELQGNKPVFGLSYYEAMAFAVWAGGRLPHEYEWETAARLGLLEDTGEVWEWCCNTFFPYDDFTSFPYEGYSVPYFDGEHYTLKGGSRYTMDIIKRPSFRNYYQANKRHIHAGLRLVFD